MPNPKLPSVYNGGLSMDRKKRLESVKIPDKIPCQECKKPKTAEVSFSNKQILDFKSGVATGRIKPAQLQLPMWITCVKCTPKQKTEMLCIQCQTWKDLDGFTKVQRKTPDLAMCKVCVYANVTATPMNPKSDELFRRYGDDGDSEEESDDGSNPYCPTEMTESAAGVPISGTSSQRLNDENLRAVPSAAGNPSAWNSYARSGQPSGQAYTAYDPQGRAHTKVHTPSIADTEESFAPTTTTRTSHVTDREMQQQKLTSKFPRVLGIRHEPKAPAEYVGGRAVEDDDDDDESDGSYGYI